MTWTDADLDAWVEGSRRPLRNGVFMTATHPRINAGMFRKCINGVWFPPRGTVEEAAACQQVATDAPGYWRGLVRNCVPALNAYDLLAERYDGVRYASAWKGVPGLRVVR